MESEFIKIASASDIEILAELASELWTETAAQDFKSEFAELVLNRNARVFMKYVDDVPIGFAQCQLRYDYVEGTYSSPVGYLEGIFIKSEYRNCGYAKQLLTECEKWAKENGCQEFASDCELDNLQSLKFHLATGFTEANRIICFTKKIN